MVTPTAVVGMPETSPTVVGTGGRGGAGVTHAESIAASTESV